MVEMHPFRGLRPVPRLVREVACPPYDVLGPEEARELARGNPRSFLRVIRAEVDREPGADPHGEEVYQLAARNLQNFIEEGILVRDESPCFYVYRLTQGVHVQHGLVAGVDIDDYEAGRIKRHELTRPDKEKDRARHIEAAGANTGPVLLTYRSREDINRLVAEVCSGSETACDFVAGDGVGHTLWVVSAPGHVASLREAFLSVEELYIADGHHRAASATRVRGLLRQRNPQHTGSEAYNQFLGAAFPERELRISGYHRLVRDLGGLDKDDFLSAVASRFGIEPTSRPEPEGPGRFGMYLDGIWYRLAAPGGDRHSDPVDRLDVSVLQERLLGPVLGIQDPRTDKRLEFVGGAGAIEELERRCAADMRVAFLVHPVGVDQLMEIADRGRILPPKSTWFEPKLLSGMVVRSIQGR